MITPRFSCSQTSEAVLVSIYCPSIRASDVEIHIDDTLFSIHVNPYFLRLNFSHSIVEDDESQAKYDPSSGYLTVTLTKADKGQEFQDLDLLAKLLAPRPTTVQAPPSIEVVSSSEDEIVSMAQNLSLDEQEILEAAQNDWQLPQKLAEDPPTISIKPQKFYGFLDKYTGYFKHVAHTENEVNELGSDAEIFSPLERREKRLTHENEKWDEEHYMADFADDEYIQELISWDHRLVMPNEDVSYTEKENLTMLKLPRKEYIASPSQTRALYLTLVSLLFSYAYESRTTQCEPTPESAWTICSLVPAFTALDPPPYGPISEGPSTSVPSREELQDTLAQSYRRCLAFPLYRSFALAEACRQDVAAFFSKGRRLVLRCLLDMKDILDHHEVYYIYSKLWIDDFCVWIQAYASDDALIALGQDLRDLSIEKDAIGWHLADLEAAVRRQMSRASDSDDESGDDSSDSSA